MPVYPQYTYAMPYPLLCVSETSQAEVADVTTIYPIDRNRNK
jgi:hypothetical protein